MATRYWVGGSGSKSWSDTANWSATNGGTGGASVPVTGDTVYILQGNSTIDSGLTQTGVTLSNCTVAFNGSIGTSAASILFDAVAMTVTTNSPTLYLSATAGAGVLSYEGSNPNVTITGGTTGTLGMVAGTGRISSACASFAVVNGGATITVDSSSSASTTPYSHELYGGTTIIGRPLSNAADELIMYGGVCVYTAAGTNTLTNVYPNAAYIHNSSGTISSILVYPYGKASASGATSPFTVTNSSISAYASLFYNPPVAITYTNPTSKLYTQRSN